MINQKYVMTEAEFAAKIEYEGGPLAALEYGLTPEHCAPGELHDLWQNLFRKYEGMYRDLGAIYGYFDTIDYDEDDE